MNDYSYREVMQFISENDVKFIRLAFCDIFGMQKNISIMPRELSRAFEEGISFDASAVRGFMNVEASDLLLFPDPSTLSVLPWRPSQGRVVRFFCSIRYPDGTPFEGDGREVLRRAQEDMRRLGYSVKIGTECEFYLLRQDEDGLPTKIPHDNATYLDIAPLDKGENVRRQICLTLEEMNLRPESSHHEQGPGQNEIDFAYDSAVSAADNMITFRSVVKTLAASNGLYASFLPKLFRDHAGNGLHINLSLFQHGENLFRSPDEAHSPIVESFIMGILTRCYEISVFLNPLVNSYDRFGNYEAPRYITWSHQNRSQLIRIPAAHGVNQRMELRSPDPCANPYLAFALLIRAGMEGIERGLKLCDPCNLNLYDVPASLVREYDCLPRNLNEAIKAAQNSEFVHRSLPDKIVGAYLSAKSSEWSRYVDAPDKSAMIDSLYFSAY
ncbi:MAG TPA: glutamine synthetase family protein [Candidatus Butyricicoccus stercorigallinarum]|nr:glutamine synthetase family protein [Candidatus Butyricicoccus stercorigallinarum]